MDGHGRLSEPNKARCREERALDALESENRDALFEVLSTFNDQAEAEKENSYFMRLFLYKAVIYNRCYAIEFLIRKGWHVDLDPLLRYASGLGQCSETIEGLCWLGAGGYIDYWDWCFNLNDRVVATYEILLEHNVVSLRMLFCKHGDLVEEGDSDEEEDLDGDLDDNEIPRQRPLTIFLDILGDCCWERWVSLYTMKDRDVLGFAELHARNGGTVAVGSSLLEQLPGAGPRVSALMAAALQPASLQSLCRKAIRLVGPKRHYKSWVPKLGLPRPLSVYLCSSSSKA